MNDPRFLVTDVDDFLSLNKFSIISELIITLNNMQNVISFAKR